MGCYQCQCEHADPDYVDSLGTEMEFVQCGYSQESEYDEEE